MLLSAGCNRREELWLTIVNVGEATLSPRCTVIFRLSVPLEASLYWASVLKIEKNGHLLLLGDCYIVCDFILLYFFFLLLDWVCCQVNVLVSSIFYLHRFQGL